MTINPAAGKPADPSILVNVPKLITAYYELRPDPSDPRQRVIFGTSGHRGSAFDVAFNEWHILAITQAICDYRKLRNIDGPLFLGMDTHALSEPAFASAMEVLAANGIDVMLSEGTRYTPTPAISHAILLYNRGRKAGLADGIVITPSHNPPDDGGFKYDPPHGGPADSSVTSWIESKANDFLECRLDGVKRVLSAQAPRAPTTHNHDYLSEYVGDLNSVVDMNVVRDAKLKLGVDPLGGAGIDYWPRIAEQYGLDLTIVNNAVDPTFRFMSVDWDGKIRMDPSSPYAMQRLIALKDKFDIAFSSDTDHDRHGIVTKGSGLLPPNHYLSVCVNYIFANRPKWNKEVAVGKTAVSSSMIDRVSARLAKKPIVLETEGLGPKPFHGRIVLLVSRHTASAAEMIVAFARENKLASIVGEKTAGRLLSATSVKVGNGFRLALPTGAYHTWKGALLEGTPIDPDQAVEFDWRSRRGGRDLQVECAIETFQTRSTATAS